MAKSQKGIRGGLGGWFSKNKVPIDVIKNIGNVVQDPKKAPQPSPAAGSPNPIPFSGQYDVTVNIEKVGSDQLKDFNPSNPAHTKVTLAGNGHPLILPLGEMHPGFSGSVALNVDASFTDSEPVRFAVGLVVGMDLHLTWWRGTCEPDGSAFNLGFTVVNNLIAGNDYLLLEGGIRGVRSSG
jgi:hypothetical protein